MQILDAKYTIPSKHPFSKNVEKFIQLLLLRDPQKRPSAAQICNHVQDILNGGKGTLSRPKQGKRIAQSFIVASPRGKNAVLLPSDDPVWDDVFGDNQSQNNKGDNNQSVSKEIEIEKSTNAMPSETDELNTIHPRAYMQRSCSIDVAQLQSHLEAFGDDSKNVEFANWDDFDFMDTADGVKKDPVQPQNDTIKDDEKDNDDKEEEKEKAKETIKSSDDLFDQPFDDVFANDIENNANSNNNNNGDHEKTKELEALQKEQVIEKEVSLSPLETHTMENVNQEAISELSLEVPIDDKQQKPDSNNKADDVVHESVENEKTIQSSTPVQKDEPEIKAKNEL